MIFFFPYVYIDKNSAYTDGDFTIDVTFFGEATE